MTQQPDGGSRQLQDKLAGLRDDCEAAPRFGVNGRMLILQAARLLAEREAVETVGAAQSTATAQPPLMLKPAAPSYNGV